MPHSIILGWGSLIWDTRPDFGQFHGAWELDGPMLPLEFSRVSSSREDALTLVLDEDNGSACRVAFTRSKRQNPDDAIADLRCREGTTLRNIGYYFRDGSRRNSRSESNLSAIAAWANEKSIDIVVWTDLASNFESKSSQKCPFSVSAGVAHLQALPVSAKAKAAEYMWRAPRLSTLHSVVSFRLSRGSKSAANSSFKPTPLRGAA
ncbi:hypothetical protein H9L17_04885 [Thermomonas brevis]|uniref:Uncharacterized protein n=1 Tax=Thermomonas brevis TaxID=215691 RepID=A0A7G9QVV1_9GAMM|nr:hypothetical protein [Thermomonas brevis]QNN47476.1 hypothetical protein H9L17_04885 [Thermomonas brevis]